MIGEREPGGERRCGERQGVAVGQVGVAGSDGIGVEGALRGGGDRGTGEEGGIVDVGDGDGEGLGTGQAATIGHAQDDGVHADVGVGGCARKRRRAVAVIHEAQPGGERRRGDGQGVAVGQVGVAGGDGIAVGCALRGGGDRRAGEERRIVDVGDGDGEGLSTGQPATIGHAEDDGVHADFGVGGRAGEGRRAVAVIGEREPGGERWRGDGQGVAVIILGCCRSGVGRILRCRDDRRTGENRRDIGHGEGRECRIVLRQQVAGGGNDGRVGVGSSGQRHGQDAVDGDQTTLPRRQVLHQPDIGGESACVGDAQGRGEGYIRQRGC